MPLIDKRDIAPPITPWEVQEARAKAKAAAESAQYNEQAKEPDKQDPYVLYALSQYQ